LARRPRKPVFELIENKKRVFRDDKHVVELYDIGPSPHAEEMVVAYLPHEGILFQSDLFTVAGDGTATAQEGAVHMAEMIGRLGLKVEKIVGGHRGVATVGDLRSALDKRRQLDATR
jgi:hypothetical protein